MQRNLYQLSTTRSLTTKVKSSLWEAWKKMSDILLVRDCRLIQGNKKLQRSDTKLNLKPEDVTKDLIVEPILKFLAILISGRIVRQ